MHLFSLLELPTQLPTRGIPLLLPLMWNLRGARFSMEPTDSKAHVYLCPPTRALSVKVTPLCSLDLVNGQNPNPNHHLPPNIFFIFISPAPLPHPFFTGRLGSGTTPSPSDTIKTNPSRRSYDSPHVHVRPLTRSQLLLWSYSVQSIFVGTHVSDPLSWSACG